MHQRSHRSNGHSAHFWVFIILLFVAVISGVILLKYEEQLNELGRAVLGALVSGYIFSVFMHLLPKALKEEQACAVLRAQSERILNDASHQTSENMRKLERIAAIYGLPTFDPDTMEMIADSAEQNLDIQKTCRIVQARLPKGIFQYLLSKLH